MALRPEIEMWMMRCEEKETLLNNYIIRSANLSTVII